MRHKGFIFLLTLTILGSPVVADEVKSAQDILKALTGIKDPDTGLADQPVRGTPHRGIGVRPKGLTPQNERAIDIKIHFATDSAKIETRSQTQIREIAGAIRLLDLEAHIIKVIGHTDSRGSAAYNLDLSKRRAAAVRNVLIDRYAVHPGRLVAEGRGEMELLVSPERNRQDYYLNRRTELKVVQAE